MAALEPLTLTVPSPWGLGLVLGLLDGWHHHQATPSNLILPAPLAILQERAGNDLTGALAHLDRMARQRGLGPLARLVPWDYLLAGPMGEAALIACEYGWRERQGLASGWRWVLRNPRPAWLAQAA